MVQLGSVANGRIGIKVFGSFYSSLNSTPFVECQLDPITDAQANPLHGGRGAALEAAVQ